MTECNGCGECCSPVVLPFTKRELAAMAPTDPDARRDRAFVLNDLEQLPVAEGVRRANHFGGKLDSLGRLNTETGAMDLPPSAVFYRCPHFVDDIESDEHGMCRNYENRPPMCSGFPWYGEGPDPRKGLPLDCSYRIDLIEKPK